MKTALRTSLILSVMLSALSACRTLEDQTVASAKMTRATFAIADSNSDGKLSKTELAEHKHSEALAEFDLDNDGKISSTEWAAARPSAGENDPYFNAVDKNGDGSITQDEAILFISEHVSFGNMFEDVDKNGDFSLHWKEIDEAAPSSLNVTLFSFHPDA
ncbi:MAG: EF-hand domain-containing protein [Verrucomicrobiales bacterium]|nr:EF-hand domain-containing protein [Verrucomicrobiales bacterium]